DGGARLPARYGMGGFRPGQPRRVDADSRSQRDRVCGWLGRCWGTDVAVSFRRQRAVVLVLAAALALVALFDVSLMTVDAVSPAPVRLHRLTSADVVRLVGAAAALRHAGTVRIQVSVSADSGLL